MKLTKLLYTAQPQEIVAKINEIIDTLNKSFITDDPDTIYDVLDNSSFSVCCDRLTPAANELTTDIQIDSLTISSGLYDKIVCPKCGARHFTVGPSTCTTVYYQPVYKDGVNINPDRNTCSTSYKCLACGEEWKETT